MNPDPIRVTNFGRQALFTDSNGVDPDFFFEAVAGAFGDGGVMVQAILPGDTLGQAVSLGSTGDWGPAGVSIVGPINNTQPVQAISFAITDLLDTSGVALSNTDSILGLQINSMGVDPANISAVIPGLTLNPDGDYNDDGVVDAADYTVWRDNLDHVGPAASPLANDTSPFFVSDPDYDVWVENYAAGGVLTALGVPEPASLVLIALIAPACGGRRRCGVS